MELCEREEGRETGREEGRKRKQDALGSIEGRGTIKSLKKSLVFSGLACEPGFSLG